MAVTFTVEDGSGVTGATSYISIADADQYTDDYILDTDDWDAATDAEKELALNVASRYLDRKYGQRYKGSERVSSTQGLLWPRLGALTQDGQTLGNDSVPTMLEHATVETANYFVVNSAIYPDADNSGSIKREKIKLDVLELDTEYLGSGVKPATSKMIDDLMWELLDGSLGTIPIYRG
jgi:hypothetical protein